MQVKAAPGESADRRRYASDCCVDSAVRPLGRMKVQLAGGEGTANIAESAPVLGVALEPAKTAWCGCS